MSKILDPAIRSYFFGKGYSDLRAVIVDTWSRNLASAQKELTAMRRLWPGSWAAKGMALVRGAAATSVLVFGTVFFLAASLVHVTLLLTFFLLVYLLFSLVYLTERAYLAWKGFFPVCPDCHSKNPLAEYFCPKCGSVHRRLIPSSYGIFYRTCKCSQKLPATFFLQRGQLPAACPDCKRMLGGLIEVRKVFVPVFGGPAVGKSSFLLSVLRDLTDLWAPPRGFAVTFPDSGVDSEIHRAWQNLAKGLPPAKTVTNLPRALNVQVDRSGQEGRLLYLYDPAGEAFGETEGLQLHKYQDYLSGLIFLIDPFSIQEVREIYADRLPRVESALKPSQLPAEDAFARILIGMEEHFGLEKGARIKKPVAVVVNKIDAFGLEQRLGEPAVQARLRSSPAPADLAAIRNQVVREQLLRWGLTDLVHQLETRCPQVGYFACTSLGRMPDGTAQPLEGRGVLEPLLWILETSDSMFKAERRKAA
ncbi:MAG TPA: hypothetical protein VLQ45_29680 [Thermoanaerobaculia bacterium]|nr:hypothetical protein [Thermoanaerobaculia bacterium]